MEGPVGADLSKTTTKGVEMSYKSTASVTGFSFISLLAFFLLAGVSLQAYAHHNPGHAGGPVDDGGGGGGGSTVVIHSVTTNYVESKIIVTGSGLDTVTAATLGGQDVTGDLTIIGCLLYTSPSPRDA